MNGTGYEDWCAAWLKRNGFHNIRKTQASHDQGIDLFAERGGLTYGFQCKYYSSNVGNSAVQQAYAGMKYYGLDQAAVLTDSHFTRSAKALAEETGVILCEELKPEKKISSPVWMRISALVMAVLCAAEFARSMSVNDEAGMSLCAFGILASILIMIFPDGLRALGFAAVFQGILLAGMAMRRPLDLSFFALAVFTLAVLIRSVILLRKKNKEDFRVQKEQLTEMIRENEARFGEHIAALIEHETGAKTVFEKMKGNSKGERLVTCSSGCPQEDLALAVYTLNQRAEYEKENLRFELKNTEGTRFDIKISRREP